MDTKTSKTAGNETPDSTTSDVNDIMTTENSKSEIESDSILSERKLVVRMYLLAVCHVFMNASRQPIWVLYAKQFDNVTLNLISLILLIGLIWRGISGLIYVSLSNKYGYDKAVIFLLIMLVTAIFIECIATNFYLFSFGFFLSQVSLVPVVLSCIAWLLPHKIAINYTSYLFASIIIAYLIGPAITGVIAYWISLKFVFWINFIFGLITLIYALIFIPFNIQKKIEQKQLKQLKTINYNIHKQKNVIIDTETQKKEWETIEIDGDKTNKQNSTDLDKGDTIKKDKDDTEIYPICLMAQNKNVNEKTKTNINMSQYEWFMLIISVSAGIWIPFGETVMGIYYCLYVIDNLENGNIMIGSIQLLLIAFGAIIGKLSTPKLIEKINIIINKYILLLFLSLIECLMMFFVYPNSKNVNIWYLYGFIIGIILGINGMGIQMITLQFQPSSHAGYVNGITELLRSIFKAFGLLFVGLYWMHNESVLFYVVGSTKFIQFILCVAMAIAYKLHKNN